MRSSTGHFPAACLTVLGLLLVRGADADCSGSNWPKNCAFNGDNPYDWEFVAPDCSVANPNHFSITQASDWDEINNPAYDVFCVQPGDYRNWNNGAILTLSAKGTESSPRWILLYDPDNPSATEHPVHLDVAQQAIMPHFEITGGEYWHLYRMTVKGYSLGSGNVTGTRGIRYSHLLIEEGEKSAFPRVVGANGDYVFQYIVQRNIVPGPNGTDRSGFYIESCDFQPCTIVRNEIINPAGDAIQVAGARYHGGLRIDSNEMYMTDARRTNCDTGLPDPGGLCATNEEMIVFKDPRTEPAEPSYITNNVIHHSYYFDGKSCCTSGPQYAPAINIGSGLAGALSNIIIENNIIFESSQGIEIANNGVRGARNISVKRNLLYRIDALQDPLKDDVALRTHLGDGHIEHYNVMVDGEIGLMTSSRYAKDHQCNVAIDAGDVKYFSTRGIWNSNFAYGLTAVKPGTGYTDHGTPQNSRNSTMCITTHWITEPATYCIPYGKVSPVSPHYGCAPQ